MKKVETISMVVGQVLAKSERRRSETSLRKWKSEDELKELLVDYAPNKQYFLCKDKDLCYFGSHPTLATLNRDYDPIAAQAWLIPQLTDIAAFSNCKTILDKEQIRSCADMITAEYYYMKVSELMLFFYKFKNGEYGQFYGAVSPMVIMSSLRQFVKDRNDVIYRHETAIKERKREEEEKNAISYEEYLRLKNEV